MVVRTASIERRVDRQYTKLFCFWDVHDDTCNKNFTTYDEKINENELQQKFEFTINKTLHNDLHDNMHEIPQDWTESMINQDWIPDNIKIELVPIWS